jgi:gas vesicle protein
MTEKIDSNVGYFMAGLAIGSLVGIFFAPKSGQGTREYLSQKVKEGSKHARKKARELSERADDLVERGKELVNRKKEQIVTELEDASKTDLPEKSKAKGV